MKQKLLIRVITTIIIITLCSAFLACSSNVEKVKEQLQLGNKYLQEGKYEEAILAFGKAIEIEPKNVEARIGLADAYIATNKYADAEKVLKEAVEIDNTKSEIYYKLIDVYEKTNKDKEDIVHALTKVTEIEPKNIEARIDLADEYISAKKYTEAESLLKEALEIDKIKSEIYLKLFDLYKKMNKEIDEIIELLKEALKNTNDTIFKNMLDEYLVESPKVSLAGGKYEETQVIKFTNLKKGEEIYYTLDDTKATKNSTKYTSPIEIGDGTTILRAVAINEKGAVSKEIRNVYKIEIKGSAAKIGDYIQFGSYYGKPILWRVINIDKDGSPMLFSEYILTYKPFDAAESGIFESNGGNYSSNEDRQKYGSNKWVNSNLREWLNSSDKKVKYTTQAPISEAIQGGYNDYVDETGFLKNFLEKERELIKSVTHKVLLSEIDKNEAEGGNGFYKSDIVENYEKSYFKDVTDKVFLLSVKEFEKYVYDRNYEYLGTPTSEALNNDETEFSFVEGPNYYWLRTPEISTSFAAKYIYGNAVHYLAAAAPSGRRGASGVRPALYVKRNIFRQGNGSKGNPYIMY